MMLQMHASYNHLSIQEVGSLKFVALMQCETIYDTPTSFYDFYEPQLDTLVM